MNFPILCPPLDDQRLIADFLDRESPAIDTLIAKQEQLIATLREDRTATITHAVTKGLDGDVATSSVQKFGISGFPTHWDIGPLKHAAGVLDCKHLTEQFFDDGYPLASIREVQSRYIDLSSAKRTSGDYYRQLREGGRDPRSGDIIFSRNATVGEAAQVLPDHEPFAMGQDVCLIRPLGDRLNPSYAWYVLRSGLVATQIEMMMIGSTFKRINVEGIRNLVVTWPPLDEQHEITNFLDFRCGAIDGLILKANSMIDTLREYRAALITDAVTGKIDVRGVA
jgi:type I restriction enzyme S subunit